MHVEADIRLAEAGLKRAAGRAGLQVVSTEEPACFTLRSVTHPIAEAGVDVLVGGEGIELVLRDVPSPADWSAILRLLQQLLADGGDTGK